MYSNRVHSIIQRIYSTLSVDRDFKAIFLKNHAIPGLRCVGQESQINGSNEHVTVIRSSGDM